MARGAVPLSLCPTLGARHGPTKHLPLLLYLLLLWRAACPRSERSVGGPARISLMLDFGASRPVCKRPPRVGGGGLLVILSRMVTHAVTSMPKTAKCACVALQVKKRIAGMLDVGKDIVSHFKHSYLSTNALRGQQHEINPPMKPKKLIQTLWKNKHQLLY